ncbi:hypothetical protein CES85_0783 [Ochrobactrum quorumnocens]|uniref:Uncharacterized protein n=1 Tax=Ochrobactrum quorumnocens TaxID=271865 RepID=A0A248UGG0_9HYPH|nr:hypothetical protein CES85_0783 [[Ochrobactrum] quorumnocens]
MIRSGACGSRHLNRMAIWGGFTANGLFLEAFSSILETFQAVCYQTVI